MTCYYPLLERICVHRKGEHKAERQKNGGLQNERKNSKADRKDERADHKHRVLRRGESIRADGKYQFKYHVNGTPHFVYSWRLEPTDKLPAGKKPCLSLRELEKQIGYDLDSLSDPTGKNMTVEELVERYLSTKVSVNENRGKAEYPGELQICEEPYEKGAI